MKKHYMKTILLPMLIKIINIKDLISQPNEVGAVSNVVSYQQNFQI